MTNKHLCFSLCMIMGIIEVASRTLSHPRQNRHWNIPKLSILSDIPTITVDQSGQGNYNTIQSAIDSVSSSNSNWVQIYIKAGIYNEQVQIPPEKPMIYLQGEGQTTTNVVSDSVGIHNPTFLTYADNIVVKDISFTNSHNYPPNQNSVYQATAAMINGDKSAFYSCGFYGFQDTLWDANGRHYFRDCSLTGAIDFIFGDGQSIYEKCNINVISKTIEFGAPGYITAQGRTNSDGGSGFVFKYSTVNGDGPTYLGRPWREYARVLYYQCNLSSVVVPKGWDTWDGNSNSVALSTFAEDGCIGPGSITDGRVDWERKLDQNDLEFLADISFIDKEGWIKQQPFYLLSLDS